MSCLPGEGCVSEPVLSWFERLWQDYTLLICVCLVGAVSCELTACMRPQYLLVAIASLLCDLCTNTGRHHHTVDRPLLHAGLLRQEEAALCAPVSSLLSM